MLAQCACKAVVVELQGVPIGSAACYCDTCQEAAVQIEALPSAPPVRDAYGGAENVLFRKDRVVYQKGRELLKNLKLAKSPKTNRVIATCCNSAMMLTFDDVRHWVGVYRARLGEDAPPIEMRICTGYLPNGVVLPNDVPSHRDYPPAFMMKLLSSGLAMLFRR